MSLLENLEAKNLQRAQPLGNDTYRLDFDVTLTCQGNQTYLDHPIL